MVLASEQVCQVFGPICAGILEVQKSSEIVLGNISCLTLISELIRSSMVFTAGFASIRLIMSSCSALKISGKDCAKKI